MVTAVGIEPRTSRFGVQCSTTTPPHFPRKLMATVSVSKLSLRHLLTYKGTLLLDLSLHLCNEIMRRSGGKTRP